MKFFFINLDLDPNISVKSLLSVLFISINSTGCSKAVLLAAIDQDDKIWS